MIAFSNENSPGKILFTRLKTLTSKELESGIVYRILCTDCDKFYVGQTRCYFKTRISEQKTNLTKDFFGWTLSQLNAAYDGATVIDRQKIV